ncbi:hypothetical protein B0H10DRAFT_2233554 [Mycena sp. CBHHK59/15]|nr:hypothetical protein B0H10DRAFT_2233554 [Mycena sp. CBHHK59/15]
MIFTEAEVTQSCGRPSFGPRSGFAGGVFAGLTLGLMGLDELHLRVLVASSEDPAEKRNAKKSLLRLMERGRHWVFVVLLLGNVIINESLPISLDSAVRRPSLLLHLSAKSAARSTPARSAPSDGEGPPPGAGRAAPRQRAAARLLTSNESLPVIMDSDVPPIPVPC